MNIMGVSDFLCSLLYGTQAASFAGMHIRHLPRRADFRNLMAGFYFGRTTYLGAGSTSISGASLLDGMRFICCFYVVRCDSRSLFIASLYGP